MSNKTNGETAFTTEGMSPADKLDLLLQGVQDLSATVEELKLQQEELVEKIVNLSLPGVDYETSLDEN